MVGQITGFYFIPSALSIEEQCEWIKESLISFPQPPNRTNHNPFYGPINDLFIAAKEKKILVASLDSKHWKLVEEHQVSSGSKSISASVLLRKLRWSTLGLQFEWSKAGHTTMIMLTL